MLETAPLGKKTPYVEHYAPELLYPVPRTLGRDKIGLKKLPFHGYDVWNGYELSWLNPKGKPEIALATFSFPCTSPNIVESKSFKLYLNSLNQTSFESIGDVQKTMIKDLSQVAGASVHVTLLPPSSPFSAASLPGICLDTLEIETSTYEVEPCFLQTLSDSTSETFHTHLLKSNCLATGQPDWGSVLVRYEGLQIDPIGFLKYVISFRRHSGFAEHCTEKMFLDLLERCQPEKLTVQTAYTRRGGLDINPFRSNFEEHPPYESGRLIRH